MVVQFERHIPLAKHNPQRLKSRNRIRDAYLAAQQFAEKLEIQQPAPKRGQLIPKELVSLKRYRDTKPSFIKL